MDLIESVEKILPNSDGWEWFNGARYRFKHVEGDCWYGLRVTDQNGKIKAQPIVVTIRTGLKIIKSHTEDAIPLESALEELEIVKKRSKNLR